MLGLESSPRRKEFALNSATLGSIPYGPPKPVRNVHEHTEPELDSRAENRWCGSEPKNILQCWSLRDGTAAEGLIVQVAYSGLIPGNTHGPLSQPRAIPELSAKITLPAQVWPPNSNKQNILIIYVLFYFKYLWKIMFLLLLLKVFSCFWSNYNMLFLTVQDEFNSWEFINIHDKF